MPLAYKFCHTFADERMAWEDRMFQTNILESAIRQELARVGACSLEELNERLPYYSWDQVLSVVDRLSREGTIALQHSDSSGYILSLAPRRSVESRQVTRSESRAST